MRTLCLSLLLALSLALPSWAQSLSASVPPLMTFQGRLAKPNGTPVPDGAYSLTFRLFDAPTGGTSLWSSTVHPVVVKNGVFTVLLGNGNPLPDAAFENAPYLEIQVGNDAPLSPRQAFATVAFAFKANTVPDKAITAAKIADNAVASVQLGADAASLLKVSGGVMSSIGGAIGIAGNVLLQGVLSLSGAGSGIQFGDGTFQASAAQNVPAGQSVLGTSPTPPSGYIFSGDTLVANDRWQLLTRFPTPRFLFASAYVNGKIYVLGGRQSPPGLTGDWNEEYDTVSGVWTTRRPMPVARDGMGCAVLNGKIHIFGGRNAANQVLDSHEVYDPATDTWSTAEPIPAPTTFHNRAVTLNGRIYMLGGIVGGNISNALLEYNPETNAWTTKASVPGDNGGGNFSVVAHQGKILAFAYLLTYEYNPNLDSWAVKGESLLSARDAVASLNGTIYVFRSDGSRFALTLFYSPSLNYWQSNRPSNLPRGASAAFADGNRILVIGAGQEENGVSFPASIEAYTPPITYYLHTKQ